MTSRTMLEEAPFDPAGGMRCDGLMTPMSGRRDTVVALPRVASQC